MASSDVVGGAAGDFAEGVGLVVADEHFSGGIEGEFATELPCDGGGMASDVAMAGDFGVADGLSAGFHTIEKLMDMLFGTGAGGSAGRSDTNEVVAAGNDFAAIARFDPCVFALEADWAGAEAEPVALVFE